MQSKGYIAAATLLCVIGMVLSNEQSPVFLWGASSPGKPALRTVPQKEFAAEVIKPLLKDHMIVAFLEEQLTAKDFLCANVDKEQSCYAHLQTVPQKSYYANVEQPIEAIRSVVEQREFNSIDKSGKLQTPLECTPGSVVFVNFDDAAVARGAQLEAHDAAIASVTESNKCKTVYLYMSASGNTVSHRVRRETAAPMGGNLFRATPGSQFLLFFTELKATVNGQAQQTLTVNSMAVKNITDEKFLVTLTTAEAAKPVTFEIWLISDGYFSMLNVLYDGITFLNSSINAPTTFSYACGNMTVYDAPGTNSLLFNSLQLQAPFGSTFNTTFVFGDVWSCVGFFSPAILMVLFVVIILLLIVFVGICWMMDINTMDRFDDPKGKTITVNTSE